MDINQKTQLNNWELPTDIAILPPIGSELTNPDNPLLAELTTSKEQALQRQFLVDGLEQLFAKVPLTMQVSEALAQGLVDIDHLTTLYTQLSDFLSMDVNNGRIILYLPFELLPDIEIQQSQLAASRFRELYRQAWLRLLHESEVRASYTDGDVLEPELGVPERVRKAAHLLPELLSNSIVDIIDVIALVEIATEQELLSSLVAGIAVATDRGLIEPSDWQIITETLAAKGISFTESEPSNSYEPTDNLDTILDVLKQSLIISENKDRGPISTTRAKWQVKAESEAMTVATATKIKNLFASGELELMDLMAIDSSELLPAVIKALFLIGEQNIEQTPTIFNLLNFLREQPQLQSLVDQGLCRWAHAGLIDQQTANYLAIPLTDLGATLPVDPELLMQTDYRYLAEAAVKIKQHPVLSNFLYPCFLAFGSKVKGYANSDSDDDFAILIKPEVSWDQRDQLVELIRQELPELNAVDKVLELWTNEDGSFREPKTAIPTVIGEMQVHILLGGVMIGDNSAQQLQHSIIRNYIDLQRYGDKKHQHYLHLLRQMELDLVQYRLLHKGYRQYYPLVERKSSANSDLIDWQSNFWDPGYRRVASRIFLQRVFLPQTN